jgi:hypothetical protein
MATKSSSELMPLFHVNIEKILKNRNHYHSYHRPAGGGGGPAAAVVHHHHNLHATRYSIKNKKLKAAAASQIEKNRSIETIKSAIESSEKSETNKSTNNNNNCELQEYYELSNKASTVAAAVALTSNNNDTNINNNDEAIKVATVARAKLGELKLGTRLSDAKLLFERKLTTTTPTTNNDQFSKRNVYTSYLNYSSMNPFSSNYDIVNKKKNADLVSDSTYRFNRANSSLSLLSQSLDYKKFATGTSTVAVSTTVAASPVAPTIKRENSELMNDLDKMTSSYMGLRTMLSSRVVHNPLQSNTSINFNTVKSSPVVGADLSMSKSKILKSNTTTNQFLNYRIDESMRDEPIGLFIYLFVWIYFMVQCDYCTHLQITFK